MPNIIFQSESGFFLFQIHSFASKRKNESGSKTFRICDKSASPDTLALGLTGSLRVHVVLKT